MRKDLICFRSRSKPVWDACSRKPSGAACHRFCDQSTPSWCQQALSLHWYSCKMCRLETDFPAFAVWSAQLVMSGALHPQDLQWALGLPGLVCSGKPRIYIRFLVSNHWIESMVLFSLNLRYFVLLHFRPDLRFPIVWQCSGKPWRKNIWRNTKPSEESTTYTELPLIFGPMLACHGTKHWQQWLKLLTRQLMNASDETSLRPVIGDLISIAAKDFVWLTCSTL